MRARILGVSVVVGMLVAGAVAAAVSSFDRQANEPQVAGDPTSDTTAVFPTNKQNEPTIAVDPRDGMHLIAGSNDEQRQPPCGPGPVRGSGAARNDCSFFPNVGTDGVYTSSDGGSTWTNRGLLPGYAPDPNATLVSDGDPVIVFGPKPGASGFSWANGARAYYAGLASYASGAATGRQAPELLAVSTSDDEGATWSGPVVAAKGNGYIFNDKENIWADDIAGSPFFGRVYVSWTQFRDLANGAEPVMTAYSTDGGATWSRPKQISIAQNYAFGGRQFSALRSGPDGTVYLVWLDSDVHGPKQVVATSSDGGVTWTHARDVARLTANMADPIPGANFRTGPYPTVATDASSGAVYAAWVDVLGGAGRVVVSKSTDHGTTWSAPAAVSTAAEGYAFFQGLDVAPNGRVDVAYQALTAKTTTYGTANASIDAYYVSSTDGGAHWSAPAKISSASSDPAASSQNNLARQFWGDYNTLVSTSASAFFIYTDTRSGAGCAAVDAYQHSVDGSGPSAPKPAPEDVCPSRFGNSDVEVSVVTP